MSLGLKICTALLILVAGLNLLIYTIASISDWLWKRKHGDPSARPR